MLSRRVAELDAPRLRTFLADDRTLSEAELTLVDQTWHFARVLSRYTDTFMELEVGCDASIDPIMADNTVTGSSLLREVSGGEPGLTVGPLDVDRQHWVRTGRHALLPDGRPIPPCESRFIPPGKQNRDIDIKPFYCGLYTSTAISCGFSMWRSVMGSTSSMMYPWPWYTWQLDIDVAARILEITSASSWAEFVCRYGQLRDGLLYPDWFKVAESFDAVHFTLPMVAAVQGFSVISRKGYIAPGYWDVETTLWLKWCFPDIKLVESVGV